MDQIVAEKPVAETRHFFSMPEVEKLKLRAVYNDSTRVDILSSKYAWAMAEAGIPIAAMRRALWASDRPYFVLGNLPYDHLAPNWKIGETPIASRILLGLLGALDLHPFGYRQEKKGQILHDMFPIPGAEKTFSNAGRVPFELHTENPYLPRNARPSALILLALNNNSSTATQLVRADDIVLNLAPEYDYSLRQPIFGFRQSNSFELNGYSVYANKTPVLKELDGWDELRWGITTSTADEVGQRAILELRRVAQSKVMNVVLEPGQLLIFNNRRCLHGRGPVEGKRWIKRIYGTDDRSLVGEDGLIDVWNALSRTDIDHSF